MKRLVRSLMLCMLMVLVFSCTVFASTVDADKSSISLKSGVNTCSFNVILRADSEFAGAEFGIKPSAADVTVKASFKDVASESTVRTEKNGITYFGFFAGSNKFKEGNYNVAEITCTYAGSGSRNVDLVSSKIVKIDEEGNTESDTSMEGFSVKITREAATGGSENAGGGSAGGGAGGGGGGGVITLPETPSPLANDKDAVSEKAVITTDTNGNRVADVKISEESAKKAIEANKPIEIVIPEDKTTTTTPEAGAAEPEKKATPTVKINLPATVKKAAVKVTATKVTDTTVLMKVNEDGSMTPVPTSVISADSNGIVATVESGNYVVVDNKKEFNDVKEGDWFKEGADFVSSRGLMEGIGNGTFASGMTLTTAQTQAVLDRLGGAGKEESWKNAVEKHGTTEVCSREKTVSMLYDAYKASKNGQVEKPNREVLAQFKDTANIAEENIDAFCWAIEAKIIQGMGDGTANPNGSLERGQFGAMVERFVKLMSL
ncbi:MAG: S-layer homology domain-containing protein [Clostridia bacterium]|nr:S-layer homology domain-containing protein [Clostridia bacterium]